MPARGSRRRSSWGRRSRGSRIHGRMFVPSMRDGCKDDDDDDDKGLLRYSPVIALRLHAGAVVETAAVTTPVPGTFVYPLHGMRAREFFSDCAGALECECGA